CGRRVREPPRVLAESGRRRRRGRARPAGTGRVAAAAPRAAGPGGFGTRAPAVPLGADPRLQLGSARGPAAPPAGHAPRAAPPPEATLDALRGSGIDVIKYSLGGINDDFDRTVATISQAQKLIEVHPAYFTQVRSASDFARAKSDNRLGIIFSFESAEMLQG